MKHPSAQGQLNLGISSSQPSCRKKNLQIIHILDAFALPTVLPQSEEWMLLQAKLKSASSVEDQMEVINEISSYLLKVDKGVIDHIDLNYLGIAADLYLSAPLKHPLKCALMKTFNLINHLGKNDCVTYLSLGLEKRISKAIKSSDSNDTSVASISLLSCSENFLLGPDVFDSLFLNILQFLERALSMCSVSLSDQSTLIAKADLSKTAHTMSRILIFALHRKKVVEHLLEECERAKTHLYNIQKITELLLNNAEVPLDTRTNFGFVLVLTLQCLHGSHGWMQLPGMELSMVDDEVYLLCICSGLLSGLTFHQLQSIHAVQKLPVILCILDTVLQVNDRNLQQSNSILALWRVVQQFTRVLAVNSQLVSCLEVPQIECLLKHLWGTLDHYMDSVRHMAQAILENMMLLKDSFLSLGINLSNKMCEAVALTPETKRSRYVVLATITAHLSTSEILKRIPHIIVDLLTAMQCPSMSSHVSGAFVAMSSADFKTLSHAEWYNTWVLPLLYFMERDVTSGAPALEDSLYKLIKMCPTIIHEVLQGVNKDEVYDLPKLKTLLTCLKIGRKMGILLPDYNEEKRLWFGILPDSILKSVLCHECDEIRLSALALVVDTHRSTEPLSPSDFILLRLYLNYNISCEVPSVRQQTLAFVLKLLNRMKDSAHSLKRTMKIKQSAEILGILNNYKAFLLWLLSFCFSNLKIGCNYSRRFCSLKIILSLTNILGDELAVTMDEYNQGLWNKENAFLLLGIILVDTYEENKAMATKILILFPNDALGLHDNQKLLKFFQNGCLLASSNHPADCISAAYILEFCCSLYLKVSAQPQFISGERQALDIFNAITLLKGQLEKELVVAQHDILQAACKGPMYGSLFCIRHLLQLVGNFQNLEVLWQSLLKSLVDLCFKLNNIVLPIVNSSSPEGHLPMDFNQGTLEPHNQSDLSSTLKVTAQMVLLCSWRTVKEVSLLLGYLCDCCPVLPDEYGLLCEDDLLAIGGHLMTLLEETKHRGAFEQAYVGFSLLAARLWRHSNNNLQKLPKLWLNELITAIQLHEPSGSKLCATRRSAGVPFLVQALVSGELQTGASHQSLQTTMSQLLSYATDMEKHVECRTHSLNILRALFRHAPLAEHISPFVSNGVKVALLGFKGKTWAERNSATLLFSSLMTRIFGVRRSRFEISSRNKMTGRIFFHRYPELYEFLLLELEQAVKDLNISYVAESSIVHPILLLIARLYPSSLEGTDSPMQLNVFVPLVRECASNSVLKTRVLAAKAVVPLISANILVTYLHDLVQEISSSSSENMTHGLSLQIFFLLRNSSVFSEGQSTELVPNLIPWMTKLMHQFQKYCSYPVREVILQIFELIVQKWHSSISSCTWEPLIEAICRETVSDDEKEGSPEGIPLGKSIFDIRATRVLLQILILKHENDSDSKILKLLSHKNYEVVQETLVILEKLLSEDAFGIAEETENILPDINESEKYWLECLPTEAISAFQSVLKISNTLGEMLVSLAFMKNYACAKQALNVLVHITPSSWSSNVNLKQLVVWFNSAQEGTSCAALACFSSLLEYHVEKKGIIPEFFEKGCKLIKLFCFEEKSFACRMAAVNFFLKHTQALEKKYLFLTDETVSELWISALKLTCDDNIQVRSRAALIFQKNVPLVPLMSFELLLDKFVSVMEDSPQYCLVSLLVLGLGPLPDSSSFEADEGKVFEKGEINAFIEREILTEIICKHIMALRNKKLSIAHWKYIWIAIGGEDAHITSADSLFDAIRLHNALGLRAVDSQILLPIPIMTSLSRLQIVEYAYSGSCKSEQSKFLPYSLEKLLNWN